MPPAGRPSSKPPRPLWVTVLVLAVAGIAYLLRPTGGGPTVIPREAPAPAAGGDIARLFADRTTDAWVECGGTVVKLLPDDDSTDGGANARHQRMLVKVGNDLTVLIAHNIDAAARVPAREGDAIRFRGEYEWTAKGGTVHFTHAPKHPSKSAGEGGWIEHAGKRYR